VGIAFPVEIVARYDLKPLLEDDAAIRALLAIQGP
jgi:hypothetical protein